MKQNTKVIISKSSPHHGGKIAFFQQQILGNVDGITKHFALVSFEERKNEEPIFTFVVYMDEISEVEHN